MEKLTINGSVITVAKLTSAVKEIESAVFPFDNFVIIFDVTPPGQQARIIIPTAISFDRSNVIDIANYKFDFTDIFALIPGSLAAPNISIRSCPTSGTSRQNN